MKENILNDCKFSIFYFESVQNTKIPIKYNRLSKAIFFC